MKTISALSLRNDLENIIKRVQSGESIRVTYRSKTAFLLQPEPKEVAQGSVQAMQHFVASVRRFNLIPRDSELDSKALYKELRQNALDRDPKYHG